MKTVLVETLVLVAIAAAWLATLAFARLRTPLDRLHCVAFLNLIGGVALTGAAFVSDGMADRPLKILFILLINLVTGAAGSHALGRAALRRGETP